LVFDLALLVTLFVAAVIGMSGVGGAVRTAYEPQSAAENRCKGVLPANTAETRAYSACVRRELSRSPTSILMERLAVSTVPLAIALGIALARRRFAPSSLRAADEEY
jgi:hypothetical protein